MNQPEVDREYLFVRPVDEHPEVWRFVRCADGSALLGPVGWSPGMYENSPNAWRAAWREVKRLGLVPLEEGIRAGYLTKEEADGLFAKHSTSGLPHPAE